MNATDAKSRRRDVAFYLGGLLPTVLIVAAGTLGWSIAPLEHLRPTASNVAAGATTFLLGLALVRWRWGTRHISDRKAIVPEYVPPDDLRPAELDVLLHGRISRRDVIATIIELALRGLVRIEERSTSDGERTWAFERIGTTPPELRGYERVALAGLFHREPRVTLSALEPRFYYDADLIEEALDREMVHRGWFLDPPGRLRSRWATAGWVTAIAGVPVTFVFGNAFGLGLVGAAVFGIGVLVYAAAPWRPARTASGAALERRAAGFELFLHTAESERQRFAERERIFEDYLPYAIALGLVDHWVAGFGLVDRPGAFDKTEPSSIVLGAGLVGLVRQLDARPDAPRH